MNREELIEKMCKEYLAKGLSDSYSSSGMAAALDVAVGELLKPAGMVENGSPMCGSCAERTTTLILASRRSHYLKPKSDPAVEALRNMETPVGLPLFEASTANPGQRFTRVFAEQIVAAVRAADKSLA